VPGQKSNDFKLNRVLGRPNDDGRHQHVAESHHFAAQPCEAASGLAPQWWYSPPRVLMANVAQLLEQKGHNVESIGPDATVYDAIRRMSDLDIGALVVTDQGKVVGLITERDYARNVFLKGKASPTTPVRDVMEDDLLFVGREETARNCMAIMTGKRTRHLLVMEGGELLGIVSIGDLVRSIVAEQDKAIEQLEQYIHRG
jgi:CBS domain-containing protein